MSGLPHPTIPMAHLDTRDDEPAKFRLLQQVRHAVRTRGYSVRTEKTYVDWTRRFVLFHSRRHPMTMGDAEIREFITHLAVDGRVAPATRNQALAAILFLFKQVLRKQVGFVEGIVHSKTSRKLPVVLAPDELRRILEKLTGTPRLCAVLMYGSGLRVLESVSLRVKDIDFIRGEITVRAGKGDKDRRVPLPQSLVGGLRNQLQRVEKQFALDLRAGLRGATLPGALSIKYPHADRELAWQYVFPAQHPLLGCTDLAAQCREAVLRRAGNSVALFAFPNMARKSVTWTLANLCQIIFRFAIQVVHLIGVSWP